MPAPGPVIDAVTITSLLTALGIFVVAYVLSGVLLPKTVSTRSRVLFVWHSFDSLVHFFFEGSFLYNCFFTYKQLAAVPIQINSAQFLTPPGVYFLGESNKFRLYGSNYGESPTAKLWQEYAKADKRWGGADLTVISLELLTVFIGGPLAAYICYLLAKGHGDSTPDVKGSQIGGKLAFWLIVLASGELYGGFMTFAPEWLSGNPNLDGSNWLYLWLYLVFFNMLWVFLPFYSLYVSYKSMTAKPPLFAEVAAKKIE